MIIRARSPLRLGLAGGGTDVSPYCDEYGGYVLNATIDRYAYAMIETVDEPKVSFVAADQQLNKVNNISDTLELNGELDLHKSVYKEIMENFNGGEYIPLKLTTFCDAPAGSGLGSSSTVVVTMIKAFAEFLNLPLDDYKIASLAFKVERINCGFLGGRQDQYAATFGGFNFMEFHENDRAIINTLRIKNWIVCELEASLVLYYTGVSRESANIIEDQSNNIKSHSVDALEAMHGIKRQAETMKECLLKGDFSGFVNSMNHGWANKKQTAKSVSNTHIDTIYNAAMESGAVSGKVSGAGGGGFMMFFVPPEHRNAVVRTLNSFEGGIVSNCHFTTHGTQAWRIL